MLTSAARPQGREGIVSQAAAEGIILLDVRSGMYFEANEVGRRVWELCDGTRSVSEIAGVIEAEFEAPRDLIEADVLDIANELAAAGLLGS